MDKNITPKLRVIGNQYFINRFELAIIPYDNFAAFDEATTRHIIQEMLDLNGYKLTVLYAGNTVYGTKALVRDMKRIVKADDMSLLSNALYHFFSLACGSIAHFNKYGWIEQYPTVDSLRGFFKHNEFGENILSYQPLWATDRIKVVQELAKVLRVRLREEHYSGRAY